MNKFMYLVIVPDLVIPQKNGVMVEWFHSVHRGGGVFISDLIPTGGLLGVGGGITIYDHTFKLKSTFRLQNKLH